MACKLFLARHVSPRSCFLSNVLADGRYKSCCCCTEIITPVPQGVFIRLAAPAIKAICRACRRSSGYASGSGDSGQCQEVNKNPGRQSGAWQSRGIFPPVVHCCRFAGNCVSMMKADINPARSDHRQNSQPVAEIDQSQRARMAMDYRGQTQEQDYVACNHPEQAQDQTGVRIVRNRCLGHDTPLHIACIMQMAARPSKFLWPENRPHPSK